MLGRLFTPMLGAATSAAQVVAGALAAVLAGVALEGIVVGWAQGSVLQQRLDALPRRAWVIATAAGAGLAWILGMVPSTIMALQPSVAGPAPAEPGALVQYGLAVVLGAGTGPILGLAQWTVLRRRVRHAARWLGANALAWAVGMPLIFMGMDFAPWEGPRLILLSWIYLVCGLTGSVVGGIHGRVLVRLVSNAAAMAPERRP